MQTTSIQKVIITAVICSFTVSSGCSRAADAPKPGDSGKGGKEQAAVITADTVEAHLRSLGFQLPDNGSKSQFAGGGGAADGVVSWGFIPRPFGAPKGDAPNMAITQYGYECKQKDGGATITAKLEVGTGRFLFFASSDEADAKAMRALLQHMDAALAERYDALVKQAGTRNDSKAPTATWRGVMIRVTEMGTILASEKLPVVFESEAPRYGLSDDGPTPLMIAAAASQLDPSQVDRVLALLKKGADPKARTKDGNTALHFLCESSHGWMRPSFGKIAAALIEKGADPNAKNDAGHVPLDLAHTTQNGEMAKFMREHGAKW
jgi:hypothetical protein